VHPIEQLRLVARAGREQPTLLAREAASALGAFAGEPAALVTACRRLVDRQSTCGPVWWVASRVLNASDPATEAWRAGNDLGRDRTASMLAAALPDEVTVVVLGWPDQVSDALVRRGDVKALVVDALDEGAALAGWLRRADSDAEVVAESGLAGAVAESGMVLIEASAMGPTGVLAASGSAAAAAVGKGLGVPVWVVAGEGRMLPPDLWDALADGLAGRGPAWDQPEEVVPVEWIDTVVGPTGALSVEDALARPTCPAAPELVRFRPH
jgi:hypothetical protein